MTDLSQIWTEIDVMDEWTFPPLNKTVMLAEKDSDRKGWYRFSKVKQRRYVISNLGYTHWRGELMLDFP